ncbi:MAG TPA: hypothetical protein VI279_02555 [Rhodocyclaceae bacterium]
MGAVRLRACGGWTVLLLCLVLAACSRGGGGPLALANQANIFSALKAVATMQAIHWTERGEYAASLADLQRSYGSQQTAAVAAAARDGSSVFGYQFKDLSRDEGGGRLDARMRYGLVAMPEKSGDGPSFLLLIDAGKIRVDEERGTGTSSGIEYFKTAAAQQPFDAWPGAAALAAWEPIRMRSPQEGLKDAQALKDKYDAERR